MDVHVPSAITEQLRLREIDAFTAWEDGRDELSDDRLLQHASSLGHVLFTQDIRFQALAEQWQRDGEAFTGLVFGHQSGGTIGQYVADLELIAKATDESDWSSMIVHLPL